jgi:hypothetical protein
MIKKISALILMVGFVSISLNGQGLKDRIKNKISSSGSGSDDFADKEWESLGDIALRWEDGMYTHRKETGGMWEPGGKQEVKFIKEDGIIKKVIIADKEYGISRMMGSEFVRFYHYKNDLLYMTETTIIQYRMANRTSMQIEECYGDKVSIGKAKKEIVAFREYTDVAVEADREAIANEEKANRAKYGLEDKEVASIEMVFPEGKPTKVRSGVDYKFGLEITLADGTVMKTHNIGGEAYMEDFVASDYKGAVWGPGSEYTTGSYGGHMHNTSGSFRPKAAAEGKDVFTVTIAPKYKGAGKTTVSFPIEYPNGQKYSCNGESGYDTPGSRGVAGGRAGHGCPLVIEVKIVKHSETGADLYLCKITDGFTQSVSYLKFNKSDGSLHVDAYGGTGGTGAEGDPKKEGEYGQPGQGGTGGNGGNGGEIVLILDPAASGLDFTYEVRAGYGGSGGSGGFCWSCPYGSRGKGGSAGSAGSAGSFKKETKKVTF